MTDTSRASSSNYRFNFLTPATAFVDADLTLNNVYGPDQKLHPVLRVWVAFTAVRRCDGWKIASERAEIAAPKP